jgi:hypothetical protein
VHGSSWQWSAVVGSGRQWLAVVGSGRQWSIAVFSFSQKYTAFKLHSLWHIGYLLDNFYGFDICSGVDPLAYDPARRLAFIKALRLFGSMPFCWFSRSRNS